ncbi:Protein of function (DUF2518) [Synechococcus sp. PCC 7502]|uniref:Ycf51 family protein n=1 Tax=Synechococcus sp. PCC 7502 TaxID=1173263 RepID=UPI00029FD36B|nr:Ycf51 family protein [Synechococcus sp. PCC 7502]AFY75152.1 Protein of function (DUF2518) [Synechococcus sp. PCC 7502]
MFTTAEFGTLTQGMGILVLVLALITAVAFGRSVSWRFRMVGITSFAVVLTAGLFALSLAPITRTSVEGALPYVLVYDRLGPEAVITVPSDIKAPQLEATLKQAATNLFSPGRNSLGESSTLKIRARTILHPREGVSQLVYLGELERSLRMRNDPDMTVKIFSDRLSNLQKL